MDDWEGHFTSKSENRRRRAHRRRIIRRTTIIICVSLAILLGLWLVDKSSSGLTAEPRLGPSHGPRR